MKSRLFSASLCAVAAVLCSCAGTSVKKTWKAPEAREPVTKVAVLTLEERGFLRQAFEVRFVAQLEKAGTAAQATYDQLSLDQIKQDKRAAADRLAANGTGAVLILRLVDAASSYRETQPGGERYVETITGMGTTGWYDFYSIGFMSMSPTYGNLTRNLFLETALFDLKTEKRVWSGTTKTVLKEDSDGLLAMDAVVAKIVAAMKKDGVIR